MTTPNESTPKAAPQHFRDSGTIKINIEVMSWLKDDFDHKSWDKLIFEEAISPGTSIMDLAYLLADKYPEFGRKAFTDAKQSFFDYCAVILNGHFLSARTELDTELKEGDNIKLSPGFYGG